jgi:predicted RNase H-like HicB family nuclease
MADMRELTAVIHREGDVYVALCPELDVASQGMTRDEARQNLVEALELFLEAAPRDEVEHRLGSEYYVTSVSVAIG